jgi:hypothetical protein
MAVRVHRLLKVVAFNANGIWRWCTELSKQVQDLHIDVALLSETHLKHRERFFIPNYHIYQTDCFQGKGISHNHVDLCYVCNTYPWQRQSLFVKDKPILLSERMLHKDYNRKGWTAKKKKKKKKNQQQIFMSLKGFGANINWLALWR